MNIQTASFNDLAIHLQNHFPNLFKPVQRFGKDMLSCKVNKVVISVCFSTYIDSTTRFISVRYDNDSEMSGGSSPNDTIEKTVWSIHHALGLAAYKPKKSNVQMQLF